MREAACEYHRSWNHSRLRSHIVVSDSPFVFPFGL